MTGLIDEARRMAGEAREAKRQVKTARRNARDAARRLEAFCERNGIELELVTQTEEGHSHGEATKAS